MRVGMLYRLQVHKMQRGKSWLMLARIQCVLL